MATLTLANPGAARKRLDTLPEYQAVTARKAQAEREARAVREIENLRLDLYPATKRQYRHALRIRARLHKDFPNCFAAFGAPKQPLKVGIHEDICRRYNLDWFLLHRLFSDHGFWPFKDWGHRDRIAQALHSYTTGNNYVENMKPGAARIDLDGNPVGEVSETQAARAQKERIKRDNKKVMLANLERKYADLPITRTMGQHGRKKESQS